MTEHHVIMRLPLEASGWPGDPAPPDDSPELAIHGRRLWFFPEGVGFRIRCGHMEVLAATDVHQEILRFGAMEDEVKGVIERKEFAAAAQMLASMIQLNPHCRWVRAHRIHLLMKMGRDEDAFDEALAALRLDSGNSTYHSLLARAMDHDDQANLGAARGSLMRAVELGSKDAHDHALLGGIALMEEKVGIALDWAQKSLRLDGECFEGRLVRALACIGLERHSEAATAIEQTVAAIPADDLSLADDLELPEAYRSCCAHVLLASRSIPWERVEREIALIEAEFGWSVDFHTEASAFDADEESPVVLGRDWLRAKAPGTVRIRIGVEPQSEPAAVIHALMEIRQEARHLHRFRSRKYPDAPLRLREGVRRFCHREILRQPGHRLPDDAPEEIRDELPAVFEHLVGYPLDWMVDLELAERHPDLRHPRLFALSMGAEHLSANFEDLAEDLPIPAKGGLSVQTMLLAQFHFLATHSRGVIDFTRKRRSHPAWPRAIQVRDHFNNFTRRSTRPGDELRLITELATIAGFLPVRAPIHTQGCLW